MEISILSTKWCRYGGWPTYKKHLQHALEANGCKVNCISLESPTGHHEWVTKIKELPIDSLLHIDVLQLDKCSDKIKNDLLNRELIVTIHDPTELKENNIKFLSSHKNLLVVFIRKSMLSHKKIGCIKHAVYIPHPYKCESNGNATGNRIICTSRIDYDKNIKIILEADCGIELWSAHINRIYDYHELKGIKNNLDYKGGFGSPKDVYPGARALVDLSTIYGDGGGTQYTFLEAMDYGLQLILNKEWATKKNNELIPGIHYIPVSTSKELKETILKVRNSDIPIEMADAHEDILEEHNYERIGGLYKEVYTKWLSGNRSEFKNSTGIHNFFSK